MNSLPESDGKENGGPVARGAEEGTVARPDAARRDAIRESLRHVLEPGSIAELRILKTQQGTVSGYFDDFDKMAEAAEEWSGKAQGVYLTLNPVKPVLLPRSANQLTPHVRTTTSDGDVLHRRWLPVDLDPVRPAGVSASEEEHQLALDRAKALRDWLREQGWPDPLYADSGNGAHLLYRIDLPNDDASTRLIKSGLSALAIMFSDDRVEVDTSTSNPSRIWKVYGTLACKGDNLPDRPHRLARLLEVP